MPTPKLPRCAIYTRKSSEEGLEQDFNSLHAQREACEAFIHSQAGEGWRLLKTHYDDAGLSGATMERPALQHLLSDIRQHSVDVVVVYKVDRLTRSLTDFAKMVELFDAQNVSFVAVTQQFNTTTSMGRLTLNVLLSFAQFEREVTGERIRDKIAASKRKGMWMGGYPPLGYDARDHQLHVNQTEAVTVRHIFDRYLALGSVRLLKEELDREDIRSRRRVSARGRPSGGKLFSRGTLYNLLSNPIYVGEIRHKGASYPGQHRPIIEREIWEQAIERLREHRARFHVRAAGSNPSLLMGKLFDEHGEGLTPTHTKKGQRRYRYYVSRSLLKGSGRDGWRISAPELERIVHAAGKTMLDDKQLIIKAIEANNLQAREIALILRAAEERSRQLQSGAEASGELAALVERVEVKAAGLRVSLKLPVPSATKPSTVCLAREFPIQVRRRGVEKRLLIPGTTALSGPIDRALLKAVARAHCWLDDLLAGRAASMTEIAAREHVTKHYVSRVVRLRLLAPAVVESITQGRQAPELTAQSLLTGKQEVELSWHAQKVAFGLAGQV